MIQDRIGANRADIFGFRLLGLFHGIADAVKMFTKEDIIPAGANKTLHTLAPFFSVFFALVAFAAIPFGPDLTLPWLENPVELQVAKINAALLYIFAMLSLGVYGVILAGFASRNNYAILGGLRATAQMISYEIALGVSVIGVDHGLRNHGPVCAGRETRVHDWRLDPVLGHYHRPARSVHRLPYRRPGRNQESPVSIFRNAESEIIGYFVEYSGMKFGMFFLTDFLETIMVACLATTLFFGGWHVPFLMSEGIPLSRGEE